MRKLRSLLLGPGFAMLVAIPAAASTGVSIDVSRITVSDTLVAGEEYRLPAFGVRNPGTEPTSYVVTVSYIEGQDGLEPPASWFAFSPAEVTVGPGRSQKVDTRLRIPPDAEPGTYQALVGPQIQSEDEGARIGAAAAARLSFTVAPSSGLEAWLRMLGRFIGQNPWVLAIPVIALLAAVTWFVRRRFSFSVARRA
jgi:hypothetical protein